jgi:hypothetical protein
MSRCAATRPSPRARAAEPAAQDRLRADARIGLESCDGLARDPAPEHALDVVEQLELIDTDQ